MLKRIAVAALLAVGLSSSASATTVTYLFSGVESVTGNPFTATFLIELATPGTPAGFYQATEYIGAVVSASSSIGSGIGVTGANIIVRDSQDEFWITSGSLTGTDGNGNALTFFQVSLVDFDGTAFSSQMLQVPVDVSQFEQNFFIMLFANGQGRSGTITSIQLVPEPSLAALLGAGVLALALRRRIAA